jgi:hypothetical protein
MSTSPFTLLEKPLGRSLKEIKLSILSFPPVNASITDKARAFDYTINAVHGHLDDYDYNELSSFLTGCIPGNCGAAASEAIAYGIALRRSIFDLNNVEGLFFSFLKGTKAKESDLNTNPALRSPDIMSVTIRSTVDPNKVAPASVKISQPSFTVELTLPLPQSTISVSSRPTSGSPVSKFKTPRQSDKPATEKTDTTDIGLASGTDIYEDYSSAVLNDLSIEQIQHLSERSSQLGTPTKTTEPSLTSPRMLAALRSSSNETVTTYTGPLNFLDDQASFDNIFPHPSPTGKNSKSIHDNITKIIGRCQYFVLTNLLRQDYVGSDSATEAKATMALTSEIRNLRSSYRDQRTNKQINKTPNDLFLEFMNLALGLPTTVASWGLTLAHQFHAALPEDCRKIIESSRDYTMPDASLLTTKSAQLDALRSARKAAVTASKQIDEELERMQKYASLFGNKKPNSMTFSTDEQPSPPPPAPVQPQYLFYHPAQYPPIPISSLPHLPSTLPHRPSLTLTPTTQSTPTHPQPSPSSAITSQDGNIMPHLSATTKDTLSTRTPISSAPSSSALMDA